MRMAHGDSPLDRIMLRMQCRIEMLGWQHPASLKTREQQSEWVIKSIDNYLNGLPV